MDMLYTVKRFKDVLLRYQSHSIIQFPGKPPGFGMPLFNVIWGSFQGQFFFDKQHDYQMHVCVMESKTALWQMMNQAIKIEHDLVCFNVEILMR